MRRSRWIMLGVALLLLTFLAVSVETLHATSLLADIQIRWSTLSGGGAPVAAGDLSLIGSLGQTANGSSAGGGVTLGAGYLYGVGGGGQAAHRLYQPLILRSP
jgi:hypothetical protein